MLQTPCQPGQLPPVPGAWLYLEHGQSLAKALVVGLKAHSAMGMKGKGETIIYLLGSYCD